MSKLTIASIASQGDLKFCKSYIKNIEMVDHRLVIINQRLYPECDYQFDYNGKTYRVNSHIKSDEVTIYSAKYTYETMEMDSHS